MLMSKSRLEKFLYALYSLDSSDLPTPLSRIEELYKCWVTGEKVPSFKPLSRVEKYLMVILGLYDIETQVEQRVLCTENNDVIVDENEKYICLDEVTSGGIPAPISRIEKLLYKLATGDDNLDDVKSFLSKHEELLAEIIRNGGVGGNIDIEYMLYTLSTKHNTLYNTAEKPVKSAILKGQTLVNLASCCEVNLSDEASKIETGFKFNAIAQDYDHKIAFLSIAKPNTYYTYIFTSDTAFEYYTGWDATNGGSWNKPTHQAVVGLNVLRVKTEASTTKTSLLFRTTGNRVGNKGVYLTNFMILEGDYTNLDIPYFEGMQSVKMPVLTTSNEDGTKTNILTINEEVTLHGIGDVRDELNPFTGELTQRIGEFVFDGDERFKMSTSDNNAFFYHELGGDMLIPSFTKKMISNNLLDYANYATMKNTENSMYTNGKSIYIHLTNDINSVSLLQTYLANNPIKIITYLSNESVKTVDLSVVDQDGNSTKLSTFNDITHVTLSSEGLIPKTELEVATKNEEDLEDSSVYTTHTLSEEFNTLYNTAEKPVKSAILKGDTLTNLSQSNGEITLTPNSVKFVIDGSTMIKSNTTYTVSFNCLSLPSTNFIEFRQAFDNTALKMENISVVQGHNKFKVKTVNNEVNRFRFKNDSTSETDFVFNNLLIIEGDYTNIDIPYFEGMQSVQMPVLKTTGKNLFDNKFKTSSYASGKAYFPNGTMTSVAFPHTTTNISRGIASIIKVEPDTSYTVTISNHPEKSVILGSGYENIDDMSTASNAVLTVGSVGNDTITTRSFTTTSDCNYMVIGCYAKYEQNTTNIITFNEAPHIQLEEGSEATEYEHHESTTVTCEGVELRGIGDVKDELDLVTGEVTQRIGEVVLDGSEGWDKSMNNTKLPYRFICANLLNYSNYKEICDSFKTGRSYWSVDTTGLYIGTNRKLVITFESGDDRNNYTVAEFKQYLSENPITVQYYLTTESVKTVDLSVVDQDGNSTKLSTFNDITHVTLSSEGLTPEAELEVAEKVPEVAANMFTISRDQEVINTTANEQSENVDATMIATTEIYEGLL